MANYKVVDADKLDADLGSVADAIRKKGGTTEALAFPEGFINAIPGALSNAEDNYFGLSDDPISYALTGTISPKRGASKTMHQGIMFTVQNPVSVRGFRIVNLSSGYTTTFTAKLCRKSDGSVLAKNDMSCAYGSTNDAFLNVPVDLEVGETYAVFIQSNPVAYVDKRSVSVDSRLGGASGVAVSSNNPSEIFGDTSRSDFYGVVFPILGEPVQAEIPTEYQIQLTTMDSIAQEAQRLSGATTKMSPAGIVAALQATEEPLADAEGMEW